MCASTAAPHFLTDRFAPGEQEALTAAVIAEFNVLGKHVVMDLHGRFSFWIEKIQLVT